MGNEQTLLYENIFEELVECKNINCKSVIKIESPELLKKIYYNCININESLQKEKNSKKKILKREKIQKTLIELFTEVLKNNEFMNNILNYLKKLKVKCKKEYIIYTKELIRVNYIICKYKNQNSNKNSKFLLEEKILEFTEIIINNIKIDQKIIDIEDIKFFLYKERENIYFLGSLDLYNSIFNFKLIKDSTFIEKYKINKNLISLHDKLYNKIIFPKINLSQNLNDKEQLEIYNLYNKYIILFDNLLTETINKKKYIEEYTIYYKSLNIQDKENYIKMLENYSANLFYLETKNKNKLITKLIESINYLLEICKKN